ncbi:carboxylating nicotinate-nucleotide diphosphorylase [Celerinatantimonas yamalensis]|uniref:nicotinate-nucleotide diphosphorylase (carboxylating) n=1 Tax=Celerinatantimonas yamalensis TaxID=559956 RepID=A0ABW9GB16_9GAMM
MHMLPLKTMLNHFLQEDIGYGDLSANAVFGHEEAHAVVVAKQAGIFCGADILSIGYRLLNEKLSVKPLITDGQPIEHGTVLAQIQGSVRDILTGERVLLNLLQHLSGIATTTHQAIDRLDDPTIKICDTRKTTPGLRMLEKYAVKTGGGKNHRFGLDDGVMIKDNHIAACGSIARAVEKARAHIGHMVKIEVEIEDQQQLQQAIAAGADVIMFDNCTPAQVAHFQSLTPAHIVTEASGGITANTLAQYRHSGVNFISLGYLTHSVQALDISLDIHL